MIHNTYKSEALNFNSGIYFTVHMTQLFLNFLIYGQQVLFLRSVDWESF